MTQDIQNRLSQALTITEEAAKIAMLHFRMPQTIETKPDQSPVTVADKAVERSVRAGLERCYPGESVYGEEYGHDGLKSDLWIVDPIDGTRSFISGLPLFGMLVGFLREGLPELGIIRMPALNEVYTGALHHGATMNGEMIKSSNCKRLSDARIFLNEADKIAAREPGLFSRLITAGSLRRMAADCYPHALVASGHADAVIDFDLQPYDFLPVSAVVNAAGGLMTDWQGNSLSMKSDGRTLTAATPSLHAELLSLVND